jgi:EAL and modified HD-GYP domain-containing signal transduction protein
MESAQTIVRAIADIGLERLACGLPAFINVPSCLLDDPALLLLPADKVVLEILEDIEPTPEAVKAAHNLASKGYRLALDDFVLGTPQTAFLPACKIVKVDILANKRHSLPLIVQLIKKCRVRALAEKVESNQSYARCQALGFDYFQGYFFARPDLVSSREVPPGRLALVQLLTRLQDPDVTISELEELVSGDVVLTFRLLKFVNSACVSANRNIDSVRSALLMLGVQRVAAMVSLLAMSGIQEKTTELMVTAMIRARMCEGLATSMGLPNPERHFTLGLLSVLEAMFDVPMENLLGHLPLMQSMKDALLDPEAHNPLADTLRLVLRFETGEWQHIENSKEVGTTIGATYIEAVTWAEEAKSILAN